MSCQHILSRVSKWASEVLRSANNPESQADCCLLPTPRLPVPRFSALFVNNVYMNKIMLLSASRELMLRVYL